MLFHTSKHLHKQRFVAHKQKYYTTSLRIFLPLRLYSQLNDFLNTCRKRKTAIDWQQFSFGWYSVRNTQCHSIFCRGQALDAPWNGEHFCGDKWYLIKAVCSGHIEPSDKFLSSNHWSSTDKTFVAEYECCLIGILLDMQTVT